MWKSPGPWLGLITGTAAPIFALASAGAIGWSLAFALMIVPGLMIIPLVRSLRNSDWANAHASPAIMRYNFRMVAASMAYVAGLMTAVAVHNRTDPAPAIALLVTLLPTVPALAMVFVMARYLLEETDEYLRHRASLASLIGLGVVLCFGTIWGFLETFGLVVNIWAWWVVPVWALGLAIGQAILSRHERKKEQE